VETTNIIQSVASVMSDSFMEDPMNRSQLEGIRNPVRLLKTHSLLHTKHAVNNNSLFILENEPRAFLIGFDSKDEKPFREKVLMVKIMLQTIFSLSIMDLRKILANMRKNGQVLSFNWHREFVKGRHYRIKIIAIEKALRGNGAFRKLITPAIDYADKERIPMVLETHNPSNIGLYEHFGFNLVKTIRSDETPVEQYCMIRETYLSN
jgi:ribosomal protein S18 acetylase RimI-like enzyme